MSPRTPLITLNLGSQSIELAIFRLQSQSDLILEGYGSRDLFCHSAHDDSRLAQITAALRELQSELGIAGGSVHYTIPEELTFTRFIELPSVEPDKLERLV